MIASQATSSSGSSEGNPPAEPVAPIESRISQIGEALLEGFQVGRSTGRYIWSKSYHEEKLMNRVMEDERVRVQMLRFVDVLPALGNDQDLVRHLEEYLGPKLLPKVVPLLGVFPGLTDWGLRVSRQGVASRLLAKIVRAGTRSLARKFIAGQNIKEAAVVLQKLHDQGKAFTLDLLGEAAVSEAESVVYQQQYLKFIDELAPITRGWSDQPLIDTVNSRRCPRLNLSLKLTSLYSQIDPVDTRGGVEARARSSPWTWKTTTPRT